jgi:hypothetical protein
MNAPSSYLRYLPPVLWSTDAEPLERSLADQREQQPKYVPVGQILKIFEKFLTGIDDGTVISGNATDNEKGRDRKSYPALQQMIAESVRLFQPWTVPAGGGNEETLLDERLEGTPLDWLAQWVALRQSAVWSEYQRRKALSDIVQIYAQRGTKAGLSKLLELYAGSSLRPRVVIDDASKILFSRPVPGFVAPIHTLVSQLPLISPLSVAYGPDGHLYVADSGNENQDFPNLRTQVPAVWRISASGQCDQGDNGPRPLGPPNMRLSSPKAVAVDRLDPFGVYFLDSSDLSTKLFRLSSSDFHAPVTALATGANLHTPKVPVAMLVTRDNRLLILDRGALAGEVSECRVIEVKLGGNPPTIQGATPHELHQIVEPLSIAQLNDGTVVIGDGGDQSQAVPGRLWLLQPSGNFTPEVLFSNDAATKTTNPLVAPSGIVEDSNGDLLILDAGLKPFAPDGGHPFNCLIARPAAVFRFAAGRFERVTETQQLVFPLGLTRSQDGTLYICDSGIPDLEGYRVRALRSLPLAFTVVVHFEGELETKPEDLPARRQLFRSIRDVIRDEHPVQSYWALHSETDI